MCLLAMGYNEKYFENPCEFKPERFSNVPKDENAGIEAFKSVPFSAGPRKCIGKFNDILPPIVIFSKFSNIFAAEKFANYQLKALLSHVIRHYEILPAKDGLSSGINDLSQKDCMPQSEYDPILNIRVTLKSENGILIRLNERN